MNDATHHILDWLRDAHAMEQQAETMLQSQVKRLQNYPELKARYELHMQETQEQQRQLEGCLARLGSKPSVLKDAAAKVTAFGQGLAGIPVSDEVIKSAMSSYVFEQMEIASYTILIAAAKAVGDEETQRVCEKILPEEIAMADWLKEHLPELTQAFLARSSSAKVAAKR
jgi:ferritin-like metal-binding protein YciE